MKDSVRDLALWAPSQLVKLDRKVPALPLRNPKAGPSAPLISSVSYMSQLILNSQKEG